MTHDEFVEQVRRDIQSGLFDRKELAAKYRVTANRISAIASSLGLRVQRKVHDASLPILEAMRQGTSCEMLVAGTGKSLAHLRTLRRKWKKEGLL